MSSRARRMFLLQFGAERVAKALSLRGGSSRLGWEPIVGVVVETDAGWVLLETGIGRQALEDPDAQAGYAAAARAAHANPGQHDGGSHLHPPPPPGREWTWGLGREPLDAALADVGLAAEDLALAAVSHLHIDHTGGIPRLARAGVPVAVQRRELEFALGGRATREAGYFAPDWAGIDVDWRVLDGDADLAPGVRALSTPGHTPGHMSYRVELAETGTWLFCVDASDLGENLHDEVPPGSCSGGPGAEADAEASLGRLLAEARRLRARLVPGHDQLVWTAVRHPAGGHR